MNSMEIDADFADGSSGMLSITALVAKQAVDIHAWPLLRSLSSFLSNMIMVLSLLEMKSFAEERGLPTVCIRGSRHD